MGSQDDERSRWVTRWTSTKTREAAMKSVVVYAEPFWRTRGWSGFAVSQLGPLVEIHDASPPDGGLGALFGFWAAGHPLRAAPRAEFVAACSERVAGGGLCVLAMDTELFGHWWHEGPAFLAAFVAEAARAGLQLAHLDNALRIQLIGYLHDWILRK